MTIQEMAEKIYPVFIGAGLGCTVDYNEISRRAYIKGAYAVLEEVEKAIASSDNSLAKLDAVAEVIEKLKEK